MMTYLRAWLMSVVASAVLVSIAEQLTDGAAMRRAVRFVGGLLLMLALLRPLLRLELALPELTPDDYRAAVETLERELSAQRSDALSSSIAGRTQAYIEDKADELGLAVRAVVALEEHDGVPLPESVTLYGRKNEVLGAYIARELGIAEEKQVWIETEESGSTP